MWSAVELESYFPAEDVSSLLLRSLIAFNESTSVVVVDLEYAEGSEVTER